MGSLCFVKACESGSSIGVNRVDAVERFRAAFWMMASEAVMVEAFLDGRELTCGVIPSTWWCASRLAGHGDHHGQRVLRLRGQIRREEPRSDAGRFGCGGDPGIQELSVQVYQDLNCRGMARVDFINHDGVPTSWRSIRYRAFRK